MSKPKTDSEVIWLTATKDHIEEAFELYGDDWDKSDISKTFDVPYTPDIDTLKYLADEEILKGIVGYNKEGSMVGIYAAMLIPYPYSQELRTAEEIVWVLDEEYRSLRNLNTFLNQIDRFLVDNKADLGSLTLPFQMSSPTLLKFFSKKDWLPMDIKLMKRHYHG